MVSTLVWSRPEPEHGNTTFNRLEGRNPPCHTGFRQSGRTGIGTEPGISHLYFFEQDTRRGSYQLRPERGRWLDARFRNSGEYGFGPRKVLMWTNYPNMPTGANATPELYERLVDFARRKNLVIVNDNPYSFILNEKPISILSVPGAKECCIEFNSMSKSHNMPGWRIGMLASNPEFVQWILKVKSNIDSGMFRAMQLAAATALEAEADWYDGNNRNYRNRRHLAGEIMKALGCTYDEKQVGMFLWGKIPDSCKDVEELTEKVLHEARVFITPGFIFGSNGARYIRISLCCKDNKLAEALERIKRIKNK